MATECGKSLMRMLLDAGYPKEEMFHHESDLYVYVTPLTRQVIDKWHKEKDFQKTDWNCPIFTDQVTGRAMYDIPFQYLPWWEEKACQ